MGPQNTVIASAAFCRHTCYHFKDVLIMIIGSSLVIDCTLYLLVIFIFMFVFCFIDFCSFFCFQVVD